MVSEEHTASIFKVSHDGEGSMFLRNIANLPTYNLSSLSLDHDLQDNSMNTEICHQLLSCCINKTLMAARRAILHTQHSQFNYTLSLIFPANMKKTLVNINYYGAKKNFQLW
jgi:hypothetical protein